MKSAAIVAALLLCVSSMARCEPAGATQDLRGVGKDLVIVGGIMAGMGFIIYQMRGSYHRDIYASDGSKETISIKRGTPLPTKVLVTGGVASLVVGLVLLGTDAPDSSKAALRLVPANGGVGLAYRF